MVIATVELIIDRYSDFCIDDVQLCMANLFQGLYGEIIALDIERFGKALNQYREEKRNVAVSYNPKPEYSNQFPKDRKRPCKMPENIRAILKETIGYVNTEKERRLLPKPVYDPEKFSKEEIGILQYFDEKWHEQGNRLKEKTNDTPIIEYDGVEYTRGSFMQHAKKIISENK